MVLMKRLALTLLSVLSLATGAQGITEQDLTNFIPLVLDENKIGPLDQFAASLMAPDFLNTMQTAITSSNPQDVVKAMTVVPAIDGFEFQFKKFTPDQISKLEAIVAGNIKSPNPYIRLAAFQQTMLIRQRKGGMTAIPPELNAAYNAEKDPVVKTMMYGSISQARESINAWVHLRRVLVSLRFNPNLLQGAHVIMTSAVWCGPCKALKRKFAEAKFPENGTLQVTIRNVKLNVSYETLDVDEKPDVVSRLKLSSALPAVYLVKGDKVVAQAGLTGTDVRAFRETVEQVTESAGLVRPPLTVDQALTDRLMKAKPARETSLAIFSTGASATDIPLFSHITALDIMSHLRAAGSTDRAVITLFGAGKTEAPDVMETLAGIYYKFYKVKDLLVDDSLTRASLLANAEAMQRQGVKRQMQVYIGHGSRRGFQVWRDLDEVSAEDLTTIVQHSNRVQTVFVSGLCYGGQFAEVPRCGFFAARPDSTAAGCWTERIPGEELRDYTSTFFSTLNNEVAALADRNGDGKVSLNEAHWYVVAHGNKTDSPFTTYDALVDAEFKNNKKLPEFFALKDMDQLQQFLTVEEVPFWEASTTPLAKWVNGNMNGFVALRDQKVHFELFGQPLTLEINGLAATSSDDPDDMSADVLPQVAKKNRKDLEKALIDIMPANLREKLGAWPKLSGLYLRTNGETWSAYAIYPLAPNSNESHGFQITDALILKDKNLQELHWNRLDLKIAQLLRRLIFRANMKDVAQVARVKDVQACEAQDLRSFVP